FPQDVEQPAVHVGLLVGAPVAEEVVELLQRVFVELTVLLVGDGEAVVAVGVVERQRARVAVRDSVLQAGVSEQKNNRGQSPTTAHARYARNQCVRARATDWHP